MVDFISHGFKTGNIHFDALDIIVNFADYQFYRNDGVQKDLDFHVREVYRELGMEVPSSKYSSEDIRGKGLRIHRDGLAGYVIFCKSCEDVAKNPQHLVNLTLHGFGHEETHVLCDMDFQFLLDFELNGVDINAEAVFYRLLLHHPRLKQRLEEDIAELGGFLAVYKRNPDKKIYDSIQQKLELIKSQVPI